uniref:Uncharacterized protein n=1 Tax=Octopus bimaculoides TaxID=37653 RepID=A0A0L8GTT4_OCTBM
MTSCFNGFNESFMSVFINGSLQSISSFVYDEISTEKKKLLTSLSHTHRC